MLPGHYLKVFHCHLFLQIIFTFVSFLMAGGGGGKQKDPGGSVIERDEGSGQVSPDGGSGGGGGEGHLHTLFGEVIVLY